MNYDYEHDEFTKCILAGVFAGITATVLSLIYNSFFRGTTGFFLSTIINVSTVIFALLIVVTLAGYIFYVLHHNFKKGTLVFQVASAIVTFLLLAGVQYVQRSQDITDTLQFRQLLYGIISITGLCVILFIPFLYKHDYI